MEVGLRQLREMGFKEPQIRAAKALAADSDAQAANLLLQLRGIDPNVMRDGDKLAAAIGEAVTALDRQSVDGVAVLRLVSLLCVDEARLHSSTANLDLEVLASFLLAVLERWSLNWSPELVTAASIAVELMVAKPVRKSSFALSAEAGWSNPQAYQMSSSSPTRIIPDGGSAATEPPPQPPPSLSATETMPCARSDSVTLSL
eukprot:NODE_19016_length_864_cov_3.412483.p1 GENE.NODE_19016_length_864_cov_3.412483~~NODE_19016_length_864_cov_3.412483.p1  ORF type:complete len:202 (-),score=55.85 NODE_19016_length_864_cov_3.412483:257-862(-)